MATGEEGGSVNADKAAELYRGGMSMTKIALRNGTSPARVKRLLIAAGVDVSPRRPDHTKRDARIRARLERGEKTRDIARIVGCNTNDVQAVSRRMKESAA